MTEAGTPAEPPPPAAPPRRRRRKWPWIAFGSLVVLPFALMAAWTAITLTYTYSSGERTGFLTKLSKKGWLCKTWEGELQVVAMPGSMPEMFYFTIRDDSVARTVMGMQGKRVSIDYEQHRGVPFSCFGETDYFVTGIKSAQ
ncbi:MAG TPA: hypothetical protein VNA89_07360 [Gemmatimonadaceae bacterium]|nr:hypothetical protein [Gemmatimonadaceae bacterium]